MPRQTVDIPEQGQLWTCDHCGKNHRRRVVPGVPSAQDESARVAGWIIGPGGKPVWCPVCTGKDPEYWIDWAKTPDWALAQWLAGGE